MASVTLNYEFLRAPPSLSGHCHHYLAAKRGTISAAICSN